VVSWLHLMMAVLAEIVATSALKAADGFTRLRPSLVVVLGYAVAFYFLSLALKGIPLGIAYAVWSGAGIVLISIIGWIVFGQGLDAPALIGIALIVGGVCVINLFSTVTAH
jgi:small multidrug resistance pump